MHNVRFETKDGESMLLVIPVDAVTLDVIRDILKNARIEVLIDEKEHKVFYPTRIDTAINMSKEKGKP